MRGGEIVSAVAQDHWRLGLQGLVLGLFVLALVAYAGLTGLRAVISFAFAAMLDDKSGFDLIEEIKHHERGH